MNANFNQNLVKRLLPKCQNIDSLLYAYNNTKGVKPIAKSTMYHNLKKNGIVTNFVRGSKKTLVRSTVVDRVLSGISIDRRLDTSAKSAIRAALGGVCCVCGTSKGLEIDHIDGNRNNTQIFNLQLLCGTCHNMKHLGG